MLWCDASSTYYISIEIVVCLQSVMYVFRELLEVSAEVSHLGLKLEGCVTNANYSVKKSVFLLFINRK